MKRISRIALAAIAVITLFACNNLKENAEPTLSFEKELIFTASREGVSPDTKTVRMDDGSTWWNASEEISVFYGSGTEGGNKLVSQNTTLQEVVEFSGSVNMSGSGKEFWAVYPYSPDNACDGTSITTVIPDTQIGSEGNFSGDAFPAMAKAKTLDLAFWNICGGIKFFVSRSDIKSVTFKGNNDEVLAGKVRVSFDNDGKPVVTEVLDGKTEVTLTAPDGGSFKAGKYYYLTLLPCDLSAGFTMTFNTVDSKGDVTSNNARTVKRSIFGVLKNVDSKVTEWVTTMVMPDAVDLGLSVKWASFNIGATAPEGSGDYFAWGEAETKASYNWSTYKWCSNSSYDSITKYNWSSSVGIVDNKLVLDLADDAAYAKLGGNWRMPTKAEQDELRNNCTWTWTTQNGVYGELVTGPNGNSIFLPAAGYKYDTTIYYLGEYGFYMTNTLSTQFTTGGWEIYFDSAGVYTGAQRCNGRSIRPVYDDRIHPKWVSLNKPSISLYVGDSEQLTATILPANATDKSVSWSSDNNDVATIDENGIVTAVSSGSAIITVTTTDRGLIATCAVTVEPKPEPEAVDLGLSVKWATYNVGATKPEEYGDYFAWGETQPKDNYNRSTYKFELGTNYKGPFSKYVTSSSYGTVDNKTVLEPEDDAAHVNWGGSWRMPTDAE